MDLCLAFRQQKLQGVAKGKHSAGPSHQAHQLRMLCLVSNDEVGHLTLVHHVT